MSLAKIFLPNKNNRFIWLSAISLLFLLFAGIADPFAVVMAYFLETLIIGLVHAFKMLYVAKKSTTEQSNPKKKSPYFIIFFLFHYSFFVAVQSIFVFAIFQFADTNIREPFNLIANYWYVLSLKGIGYSLLIMLVFIGLHTYFSFIRNYAYHHLTLDGMFFQPYLRIFVQQFTVILSMFFIAFISAGIIAAVILIVLRLFVDLVGVFLNSSEENKRHLATKLSESSDQEPDEIYDELNNLF